MPDRREGHGKTLPRVAEQPTWAEIRRNNTANLLRIGEVLGGNYVTRRLIGTGGMAQVFEADDHSLARRVAIKVAKPLWPDDKVTLLREEAKALAAVRHPGLIAVHAIGSHRGLEYMVMELIPGMNLDERLDELRARNQRMPIDEVVDILAKVADALTAVHHAGLAHRDVKPANIILGPDHRVVLSDFGIFTPEVAASSNEPLVGTPAYMAPEVVGQTLSPGLGHLVDVYALGVVGYELLTGSTPTSGTVTEVLLQQLYSTPAPLAGLRPDVPPKLDRLITECLAKQPLDRPAGAEAVAWRLREIVAHAPPHRSRRLVVAIIDDDPDSLALMRACVEARIEGAEVLTASDPVVGLALLRKHHPALILLDMRMPGMNGLELLMYVQGTHMADDCRVVLVSGAADARDLGVLRQLGVTEFVRKGAPMVGQLSYVLQRVQEDERYR